MTHTVWASKTSLCDWRFMMIRILNHLNPSRLQAAHTLGFLNLKEIRIWLLISNTNLNTFNVFQIHNSHDIKAKARLWAET
jgi:hypothetical protein